MRVLAHIATCVKTSLCARSNSASQRSIAADCNSEDGSNFNHDSRYQEKKVKEDAKAIATALSSSRVNVLKKQKIKKTMRNARNGESRHRGSS